MVTNINKLKIKLVRDKYIVLYLTDNINNTIVKKLNRSSYPEDKKFLKLYKQELEKNTIADLPLERPLYTPFTKRKNDTQTTLYSMNGPLQRLHADIADIRFMNPNASEPKYALVVADLFSSHIYVMPMKDRSLLDKAMGLFYLAIKKDRINQRDYDRLPPLYIQTDMEFNRKDIELLNAQHNVEMYQTKMNSGHTFAAEQKIRELKKILTKQSRIFKGGNRQNLLKNLDDAVTQMNNTRSPKYSVKPGKVQELTLHDEHLRDLYNNYRLDKVGKHYARTSRYETETLRKKNRHLRELFIGDLVYVEAGRIKKKDQHSVLTKATTDLKPHFNTDHVYKIAYKKIHKETGPFIYYWMSPVEGRSKNITHRFTRDELFALLNNIIY